MNVGGGMISPAIAMISAMITPALLILASASLVASALVRLSRAVDRGRVLIALLERAETRESVEPQTMRRWLDRHERRSLAAERAIAAFFAAVALFVAACLGIAIDRQSGNTLTWLPVGLVIGGMLLVLLGASAMLVESRMGGQQIRDELARGRALLETMS